MDFLAILKAERAAAALGSSAGQLDRHAPSSSSAPTPKKQIPVPAPIEVPPLHMLPDVHLSELVHGGGVQYAQEVVSLATEAALLAVVSNEASTFTQLSSRLVQVYGKQPGGETDDSPPALPPWLDTLGRDLASLGVFGGPADTKNLPNNVLVNQYTPVGGILHHTDGPAYCPTVAIISLGGPCVLSFKRRLQPSEIGSPEAAHGEACSVLLQPRSLLRFSGDYYIGHTHGITPDVSHDVLSDTCVNASLAGAAAGHRVARGSRVSLTFRIVPPALVA